MSALGVLLAPLGLLYGTSMRWRRALYEKHLLKTHRIDELVISVGNITTGGTGKTPLVAWLAQLVNRELNQPVCVLSRGYGRATDARQRIVVSDGKRLFADAQAGGDEPRLLAEMLQGIAAVVSDADRVAAARWARDHLGSRIFILDDGFQHLRIARDLDIVTIDGSKPWGGRRLLPSGRLREPLSALRRANIVVITRSEQAANLQALRREVERLSKSEVLTARTRTLHVRLLLTSANSSSSSSTALQASVVVAAAAEVPQPLAAFCAIGNAAAFFKHVMNDGCCVSHTRVFPDHHRYTQQDIDQLVIDAQRHKAEALITTSKDAVKLRSLEIKLPCYVVEMTLEFEDEARMIELVRMHLEGKMTATHN